MVPIVNRVVYPCRRRCHQACDPRLEPGIETNGPACGTDVSGGADPTKQGQCLDRLRSLDAMVTSICTNRYKLSAQGRRARAKIGVFREGFGAMPALKDQKQAC